MLIFASASLVFGTADVAIVTGGTRGIGAAISTSFAKKGHNLVLTHNTDSTAAAVHARRMRNEFGVQVVCVAGDLTLASTRAAVFNALESHFGEDRLCAMVHNAGQYIGITSSNAAELSNATRGFGTGAFLGDNLADAHAAMRYYQKLYGEAYIDLCERCLQRMDDGHGALIGISSPGCSLVYKPNLGYDLPGSGKCIMEYVMRLLALRCAPRRINCNVVIPGVTPTQAWDRLAEARGVEVCDLLPTVAKRVAPMGSTQARDIADVVSFLCSDAGRPITGVSLPVDGGVHLRI